MSIDVNRQHPYDIIVDCDFCGETHFVDFTDYKPDHNLKVHVPSKKDATAWILSTINCHSCGTQLDSVIPVAFEWIGYGNDHKLTQFIDGLMEFTDYQSLEDCIALDVEIYDYLGEISNKKLLEQAIIARRTPSSAWTRDY